jgi:hypothetical protein
MILHKPHGMGCLFTDLALRFPDLKEDLIISRVSNLEVDELDPVDIVLRLAEKIFSRRLQIFYLLQRQSATHIMQSNKYQAQAIYPSFNSTQLHLNSSSLSFGWLQIYWKFGFFEWTYRTRKYFDFLHYIMRREIVSKARKDSIKVLKEHSLRVLEPLGAQPQPTKTLKKLNLHVRSMTRNFQ